MYHILGQQYEFQPHQSLNYASYRHGFPPYQHFSDDVGWGCTLRCFQMVISNTLANLGISSPERFIRDEPSLAPFAIQRMMHFGKEKYGIAPGEWFGPSVAAKVLLDCIQFGYKNKYPPFPLRLRIHGIESTSTNSTQDDDVRPYDEPELLLFPVRLGIDKLDKGYQEELAAMLKHPCSMGFVSGRKTSAYYIVGISQDNKPVYMDPHELRHHQDMNYTCKKLSSNIQFEQLNPSMCIAFLFRNRQQHRDVMTAFANIFDSCTFVDDGSTSYILLDGDDDFCVVQEEKEEDDILEDEHDKQDQSGRAP